MHHCVRLLETGRVTTARRGALPKLDPLVRSASPSGAGSEEHHFPRAAVSSAVTTSACLAFPTYRAPRSSPAAANAATTTTPSQPARLALDRRSDSCPRLGHPVPRVTGRVAVDARRPYLEATPSVVRGSQRVSGRGLTHRGPADLLDGRGKDSSSCRLRS